MNILVVSLLEKLIMNGRNLLLSRAITRKDLKK